MRGVFEAKLELSLARGGAAADAARIAGVQGVLESYRQAEVESAFGDECVPQRRAIAPRELRPDEVVLYPVLLRDRVVLIYASGKDGVYRQVEASNVVGRAMVTEWVGQVGLSLAQSDRGQDWRAPARKLYDLLIRPVEGELSDKATLIIVPDGALRALPFAVLISGANELLIQRARLAVAPALAYAQPGVVASGRGDVVLSAALEQPVTLRSMTFPLLSSAGEEAAAAARGGRSRDAALRNFSAETLFSRLTDSRVDVLHLATHASFEGRSDRTFLVTADRTILLSELRERIASNRTRGDELDLLVLSACETALGDDQASMGLAGAAVQAGARSAIASLWQVNDASTAALMAKFYERFRTGESKADSLRAAQLALIASDGYAHPHFWAPFMLIGAWR
jgi:CHAT domain-containing protein